MSRKKRDRERKARRIAIDEAGDLNEDFVAGIAEEQTPAAPPSSPAARDPEGEAPAPPDIDVQAVMDELSDDAAALVRHLELERDDALAARQRALADYVNFQKRSAVNERRAHARGAADVVRSLLQVLDHFDLALGQDIEKMTVEQLLGGVQIVRDEFTRVLESHGVTALAPQHGEEFDPNWHEAMMRQPCEDIPPDHVVTTIQPGYCLGEMIIRPAKVIISEAAEAAGAAPEDNAADEDDDLEPAPE